MTIVPLVLLKHLQKIEPTANFSASLPKITSSKGFTYYAKIGFPSEAEQYHGEAESLKAIEIAAPGLAPRLFASGIDDSGKPHFLSEYKILTRVTDKEAETLGKRLATEMHRHESSNGFGFGVPTYCGATRLQNGWFESWEKCYGAMINDLLTQLRRKGGYANLCTKAEELRETVIPRLLGPLVIQPVLLHGDLWSGNIGTDQSTGRPVIFDPASYYGHNEADLAIGRMFGGIPDRFFSSYHEYYPKTEPVDQYEARGDLYELFHYLNHTLLFGGSYSVSAMRKIEKLLDFPPKAGP